MSENEEKDKRNVEYSPQKKGLKVLIINKLNWQEILFYFNTPNI